MQQEEMIDPSSAFGHLNKNDPETKKIDVDVENVDKDLEENKNQIDSKAMN